MAAKKITWGVLVTCGLLILAPVWAWAALQEEDHCGPEPKLDRAMNQAMYDAFQLMDKKKDQKARQLLERYAKRHPREKHYRFSYLQGILNYRMKDLARAEKSFTETVTLWPCYITAWRNLAAVHHEMKKPLLAAQAMLKAYQYSKPRNPQLLYQAAAFYLMARKPGKALPLLVKLAKNPKAEKKWLMALVRAHMELKQPAKAVPVVRRLLSREPGNARLWRLLAGLNLELKRHARALNALEVHYRLKPPDEKGLQNLAGLYRFNRVPFKAAETYRESFGKKPTAKQLDTLAGTYLEANRPDLALEPAQKAAKMKPTARRLGRLARLQMHLKKYMQAYDSFMAAAKLADPKGDRSLLAGHCAMRLEKFQLARRAFNQALKKAPPDSGAAKEARKALVSIKEYLAAMESGQ